MTLQIIGLCFSLPPPASIGLLAPDRLRDCPPACDEVAYREHPQWDSADLFPLRTYCALVGPAQRLPRVNMRVIAFGSGGLSSNSDCGDWSQVGSIRSPCLKRGGRIGSLATATDSLISTPLGQFRCLVVRSCWTTAGGKNGVCTDCMF